MKLKFFTCENRELLLKTLKLRHKESSDGFECNGMVFDQYDTPFAYYIACLVNNEVVSCGRLIRTDTPYMAKDVWANQIPEKFLPQNKDIYEFTRFFVDSALRPFTTRNKVVLILTSFVYLSLAKIGAKEMYFLTFQGFFNSCSKLGFDAEILCDIKIDGLENIKYCRAIIDLQNCQNVEKIMNEMIESIDLEICKS